MSRWTAVISAAFTGRRALRDAGLGGVLGLFAAILHRGLIGAGGISPRIEYWTLTLVGMAAGVLIGSRARGRSAVGSGGESRATGGAASTAGFGYRRLAAVGVLAPFGFLIASVRSWQAPASWSG
jgi:hypothetical protein